MKAATDQGLLDNLFNARHLPVIPTGVTDLIASLSDETIGYRELSVKIELFPSIAARLIGLAKHRNPVHRVDAGTARSAGFDIEIVAKLSTAGPAQALGYTAL